MGENKMGKPSAEGKSTRENKEDASGRKPKPRLEDMTRFTMIKRIW